MFLNKNAKKLDPKVRFQQKHFTEKLKEAQSYKRTARRLPETDQEKVLSGLGLDSWWSRAAVGIGIVGLLYLVYVPNFLFVKTIVVEGAEGNAEQQVESVVRDYFSQAPLYAPQRNVLLLNTNKLSAYLVNNDPQVKSVIKTTRDLGKITIAVELKQERFELVTSNKSVSLYNDGIVARDLGALAPDAKPRLIRIQAATADEPQIGQSYISEHMAAALGTLYTAIVSSKGFTIDYLELPVAQGSGDKTENGAEQDEFSKSSLAVLVPNEIVIHTRPVEKSALQPFVIYFDTSSDIDKALLNFSVLLSNLPTEQVNNLKYIDMRFPDRSFVCVQGAPCAVERQEQEQQDAESLPPAEAQ
jgi:hypothetical protein